MAKTDGFNARGSIANIIFYEMNGEHYARVKPARVKQSEQSKAQASNFSKVKTLSRLIRYGFYELIPDRLSKPVMYSVDAAVRKWLKFGMPGTAATTFCIPYLQGLSLNNEAPTVDAILKEQVGIDWLHPDKVIFRLPSLNPAFIPGPKYATTLQVHLAITRIHMEEEHQRYNRAEKKILIPLSAGTIEGCDVEIPVEIGSNSLYLAVISIRYQRGNVWVEEKNWMPVGIVGGYFLREEAEGNK